MAASRSLSVRRQAWSSCLGHDAPGRSRADLNAAGDTACRRPAAARGFQGAIPVFVWRLRQRRHRPMQHQAATAPQDADARHQPVLLFSGLVGVVAMFSGVLFDLLGTGYPTPAADGFGAWLTPFNVRRWARPRAQRAASSAPARGRRLADDARSGVPPTTPVRASTTPRRCPTLTAACPTLIARAGSWRANSCATLQCSSQIRDGGPQPGRQQRMDPAAAALVEVPPPDLHPDRGAKALYCAASPAPHSTPSTTKTQTRRRRMAPRPDRDRAAPEVRACRGRGRSRSGAQVAEAPAARRPPGRGSSSPRSRSTPAPLSRRNASSRSAARWRCRTSTVFEDEVRKPGVRAAALLSQRWWQGLDPDAMVAHLDAYCFQEV